jgi:hypothetical protein
MSELSPMTALAAMGQAYQQISTVVTGLDQARFLLPSRCAGWAFCDVLYHQLLDARRALRTFASPATAPADRDDISYWRAYSPDEDFIPGGDAAARHARHVRIAASAYAPGELAWEWTETAGAACRAAAACPHERVATQGHVLRTADFVATLAVESAVHYLDLTVSMPTAAAPAPEPLALACRVMNGLLSAPPDVGWDLITFVLKGTGRLPLTDDERSGLRSDADRFPLFG